MTPLRKTALVAGVFYLITFISIPTLGLYGSLKTDRNWITGAGGSTGVLWGAFLEVIVALAGIGTAVALTWAGPPERSTRGRSCSGRPSCRA
jgi:hypothetical protein